MAEDKCRRAFQSDASNGFRSLSPRQFAAAKATARIPLCCRLTHQALVQAALDPDVVRIDFVESVAVREIDVPLGGIILVRGDGPWLLDLPDAQPTLDIDDAGSRELAIEQLAIPRLTIATAELHKSLAPAIAALSGRAELAGYRPATRFAYFIIWKRMALPR
jgi:hypothetical protein